MNNDRAPFYKVIMIVIQVKFTVFKKSALSKLTPI